MFGFVDKVRCRKQLFNIKEILLKNKVSLLDLIHSLEVESLPLVDKLADCCHHGSVYLVL